MTSDSPTLAGQRLGVFEIGPLLGAGGMGQVYRARDTALGRDVALKALPPALTADAERLARLEREARVLASLNHPHIAAIYGFVAADASTTSGRDQSAGVAHPTTKALVLELVEGETLAARIVRRHLERRGIAARAGATTGGLPFEDALAIARQIASALEAAHDRGIVHRDLKPANVMVTPAGVVKVLDFGLAKAMPAIDEQPEGGAHATTTASTADGVLLGTASYMSPEQARGHPVDARTDIWAFGCVLYEMLAGRQAFPGDTASDRLAAVLERQPEWSGVPAAVPAAVMQVLRGCLEKDPARRWRHIADVRRLLEEPHAETTPVLPSTVDRVRSRERLMWGGVAALLGSAALAAVMLPRGGTDQARSGAPPLTRLMIVPSAELPLAIQGNDRDVAISPDGTFVVYRAGTDAQLVVRRLDRLDSSPLTNVRNARMPFVSPDGRWVGYVENNTTLRKVAVSGGSPISLATIPGAPRGAAWIDAATIVVATNASGLLRVSATGGEPTPLTAVDRARGERAHGFPAVLPGGTVVLYTITMAERAAAQIAVLDLRTLTSTQLISGGSDARYIASGHLLYASADSLLAVPFDPERRAVQGAPVPIAERVTTAVNGALNAAVTEHGVLVYVPVGSEPARSLIWVDRRGREEAIPVSPGAYSNPRLSPDGTKVALLVQDGGATIGVWDFKRQTLTRLGDGFALVWTTDGHRLVFAKNQPATSIPTLHARAADGSGIETRLTTTDNVQVPTSATATDHIISDERRPSTGTDIVRVRVDWSTGQGASAEGLVETTSTEQNGDLSPDGRFLAFESNERGRFEIYATPYPHVANGRWQLSRDGGTQPVWTSGGKELVFLDSSNRLTVVPVERDGSTLRAGVPTPLSIVPFRSTSFTWRAYDVSRDGQRFLILKDGAAGAASRPSLVIVQNFQDELKRLAPP
jgi:serine/threonine-protein kinase